MKRYFLVIIVFADLLFFISPKLSAQNSIGASYGIQRPFGNNFGKAFNASGSFGLTFLHKEKDATWAIGGAISRQKFSSSKEYFSPDYNSSLDITNMLFSIRKDIRFKKEHIVYFGIDAGLAYYNYRWVKPGNNDQADNIGFSSGLIVGSDWKLDSRFSIDINAGLHYTYTDALQFDNQYQSRKVKYAGINFGVKYLLNP